jgi:hypothetical protein
MEEVRNAYEIFIGIPEENKPLKRRRLRWKENINVDFRELEC